MAHYSSHCSQELMSTWITVEILELIHASKLGRAQRVGAHLLEQNQSDAGYLLVWVRERLVNRNNYADRTVQHRRRIFEMTCSSTFDGTLRAYHGDNG